MIIQVSLKNSNFFYKHVSVHYHIMHYHYLKLNSVKKKKLQIYFCCGFLSCDSDYEKIDSVLSAYA